MEFLEKLRGASVDFTELIKAGALVIDVRSNEEFKSGHVKGSKNIPLQTVNSRLNELKGKIVILVCRSGARAGQANNLLKKNGIEAHNAGAWQNI
ncbi:MAG: phage shock protein E [Crocinitomix sp.]|jgi:phage shock protein E